VNCLKVPDIRAEHEFAADTNDTGRLKAGLALMSARICGELRQSGKAAEQLTLTLVHTDTLTRTRSMEAATEDEVEMLRLAWDLLLAAWTRRVRIRHITLICTPRPPVPVQPSLFAPQEGPAGHPRQLRQAMDRVRARFGTLAVQSGAVLELGALPVQAARDRDAAPLHLRPQ